MADAKEDPYGWLIKLCQPTSSQELKLQSCCFAGESDFLPDCDTSEHGTEPLGTVIGSQPEIANQKRSSIDKSDTQENEKFLTPPESHIPSSSSSQEDRQRQKTVTLGDANGSDSVVAETMFDADDGRLENKVSINLGTGDKKVGFSTSEKIVTVAEDSEGKCRDSVNYVEGIGRFRCELKRFNSSNCELDQKRMSKKVRVLEQSEDSEINNDKIIELDTEEIDEEIQFDKAKTFEVDTSGVARENEENKKVGESSSSSRYVKVKKASWTDIVNALERIFWKEDDDGFEDIDLLEVVKRRGITFPKPRWL